MLELSEIREAKDYQSELNYFENKSHIIRQRMENFKESVRVYVENRFNQFIDQAKEKIYVWVYFSEGLIQISIVQTSGEKCQQFKLNFEEFEKIFKMSDDSAFEEIKKHLETY